MTATSDGGQSHLSAAANAAYFLEHWHAYHDAVASIDTYRTLHDFISREVQGVNDLLDVGNGEIFDYDTSGVGSITAVDLFFERLSARPGGRLLVIESCVPEWFFRLEKPAFRLLSRFMTTLFAHPITIQFPTAMIADELGKLFDTVHVSPIPKGKFVPQFGIKTPSFLTPIMPFAFDARKRSAAHGSASSWARS
jgi:hypothetical protein